MYEKLRALVDKWKNDFRYEHPDKIWESDSENQIAFMYFPHDDSLYYDKGVTHATLSGNPELADKISSLKLDTNYKHMYWQQKGVVNGRLTTSSNYRWVEEGFPGAVAFWEFTVRNQQEIIACLRRLLKEGLITPDFLAISPVGSTGLAIDVIKGRTEKINKPEYLTRVHELILIFHTGNILDKQKAFSELQQIGKEYPEVQITVDELKKRLPASIKKGSAWVPRNLGPGSGLEKHWGADPKDLARSISNLGMKRNSITGYLEDLDFRAWFLSECRKLSHLENNS